YSLPGTRHCGARGIECHRFRRHQDGKLCNPTTYYNQSTEDRDGSTCNPGVAGFVAYSSGAKLPFVANTHRACQHRASSGPLEDHERRVSLMSAPIKIGVIGLGRMGQLYARTLVSRVSGAHLYAIADIGEQSRTQVADESGVSHVFSY